ncbi:hypothetical protein [Luteolibacter marinus]|uniref:hypothetical protein n=1 Tax=Luteolibacter marinus TaxID=2776705 RepID=UPI001867825B|nr:hypothetical protein [Luteolibacter marinus]
MDPLEPWIDASAARRLAERLLANAEETEVKATPDTGFGTEFVGFADDRAEPAPEAAAPVEEVPARVFEAAPVPEVSPPPAAEAPVAAPAPPGRGPLLDRLARFREALIRHTGAQGVFILDREGKPVMEDPAFGKLHFLARSLAQAYRPVSGQAGNVHVKIGANAVLEVVPVETAFGCLVLGAVVPRPLAASVVGEISQALSQAATPRESAT